MRNNTSIITATKPTTPVIPTTPTVNYFNTYTGTSGSIVTALNSIGATSSYTYRSQIAKANNINSYKGTAEQNTAMLNLLKQGKLIKP